ncbi:MAG: hydrogenase maturation protease [Planctomycetaceae bacterium]|nr:hydrogenase maturation protease [Planctomycetaceae bacterium]
MTGRQQGTVLIVGIGSDAGDDQAGWLAAERLAARIDSETAGTFPNVPVRTARVPLDVSDWLDGVGTLVLIDACQSDDRPGTIHRFNWHADHGHLTETECRVRFRTDAATTHDYDLPTTLKLLERTHGLPSKVEIIAVTGRDFAVGASVSHEAVSAADQIAEELFTWLLRRGPEFS